MDRPSFVLFVKQDRIQPLLQGRFEERELKREPFSSTRYYSGMFLKILKLGQLIRNDVLYTFSDY